MVRRASCSRQGALPGPPTACLDWVADSNGHTLTAGTRHGRGAKAAGWGAHSYSITYTPPSDLPHQAPPNPSPTPSSSQPPPLTPTPTTPRQIIQMIIMLPTVPFRLAFIFCCVVGVALVNSIAIWGWWAGRWAVGEPLGSGWAAGHRAGRWAVGELLGSGRAAGQWETPCVGPGRPPLTHTPPAPPLFAPHALSKPAHPPTHPHNPATWISPSPAGGASWSSCPPRASAARCCGAPASGCPV
jgi:hypothetical protein